MKRSIRRTIPPALLLNADYRPLSQYPLSILCWQDAVKAAFQDKVEIVASYDLPIRAVGWSMPAPAVVVLRKYVSARRAMATFTRFNLYLRDRFECAYCGARGELTFDHVTPASRGGATGWSNIVAACPDCNFAKRDRTPQEAKMKLRRAPWAPSVAQLAEIGRDFPPPILFDEWRSWLYWNTPLEEDGGAN